MVKVIFKCSENMNQHADVIEFDDDVTDEEIAQEFAEWVWQEVGDHYTWYRESEGEK